MSNKVYSVNEEWFQYEELVDLINDNELKVGDIVFVGESAKIRNSDLFDADDMIDFVTDRMCEMVGDSADGWTFGTDTKGLNEALSKVLDEFFPHSFYKVVNVKEYQITSEDICNEQR